MYKTIFMSVALAFASAGVYAQTETTAQTMQKSPASPAEKAQKATEKMDGLVHLSADQKAKVQPLLEEYYTKMREVKKASDDPKSAETTGKLQQVKQNLFTKLQGVLSADQLATVKQEYNKQQAGR